MPYNSASNKLSMVQQNQCQQGLSTSSTGSHIRTSPSGTNIGVQAFFMDDTTGEKWYLKLDFLTGDVTLQCQSALDNVSTMNLSRK